MLVRFMSGLFVGLPIAAISYFMLPLAVSDLSSLQIGIIGGVAGAIGVLRPQIMLMAIACLVIWKQY